MGQERLNALAFLSIQKNILDDIPDFFDRIIDHFAAKKNRRAELKFKKWDSAEVKKVGQRKVSEYSLYQVLLTICMNGTFLVFICTVRWIVEIVKEALDLLN